MRVTTIPKLGIDDNRAAAARSRPRSVCKVGIRNAAPLMNTLANRVAVSAMTSIDQRRTVLIGPAVMQIMVTRSSHHIEHQSHLLRNESVGVASGGRNAAH